MGNPYLNATFSTTDPTWAILELKVGFRSEKPATKITLTFFEKGNNVDIISVGFH
jgi:hypothetical protein